MIRGEEVICLLVDLTKPRYSNGKESPIGSSSSPSPPPLQTPSSNGNPGVSPLLEAVSATNFATATSPSMREWAKGGIPAAMAGSPGNLISLMGESPPTQPSSYEDPRAIPYGWPSPRHSIPFHPPSASPQRSAARPLSFQMDGNYSPPDPHGSAAAAAAARRSSMHSYLAHSRAAPNPPLPHQPQAHFYGIPDIDFDPQPRFGMKAGERGYHFGFDTLPSPPADCVPGKDNVVVSGYEGGLEVNSVGKRGVEHVAALKGLRGGVVHARILPWTSPGSDLFPLVAVVIHGPVLPLPSPGTANEGDYDAVSNERSDALSSTNQDTSSKDGTSTKHSPGFVEAYQTTVEVYSLKTGGLVEVLLEAPKIPLKTPITSPVFKAPPPSGAFSIKADGGSIVVSSGVTGECWLYRQVLLPNETGVQFACLGKLWTTVQHPPRGDSAAETADRGPVRAPPRQRMQSAIISLRGRWLAYCPATPSSQLSLRASVRVPVSSKAPGLASMTPPQLPPVNSEIDLPASESVMNKIMRDATQELIQGAKWVGKQGLQAWNRYWSPPPAQQPRSPPLGPSSQGWGAAQRPEQSQFPPTHGTVTSPAPKEPGLISLLDLESVGNSPSLHPISTFLALHGCSFLSLAPSGLILFTASSKGDVQTVWDLMRVQYTKASTIQAPSPSPTSGPRVRQVAQFSRMTVARIVDVAWTRPNGERAAMVTERGTVHLLDLPPGVFTWPPPRRRVRPQDDGSAAAAEGGTSAVAMASSALSSVRDAARPLIARPRRSSSNANQTTGATFVDHASHGGKVIAASISHSLGRTGTAINQLRHTGENRVSLPASTILPGPASVVWLTTRKDPHLFVLGDGLVRTFPTKTRRVASGGDPRQRTPRLTRYRDFRLPNLPDSLLAPVIKAYLDPDEDLDLAERDQDVGNNTMVLDSQPRQQVNALSTESSIPQAEIESNAPYQPFHTDRRVALYECSAGESREGDVPALSDLFATATLEDKPVSKKKKARQGAQLEKVEQRVEPSESDGGIWVFGQPMEATKLDLGLPLAAEEDILGVPSDESRALPASAMERVLHHAGENEDQIVVTTRRRRGAGRSGDPDDDGFFEDDCEVLDFADQRV